AGWHAVPALRLRRRAGASSSRTGAGRRHRAGAVADPGGDPGGHGAAAQPAGLADAVGLAGRPAPSAVAGEAAAVSIARTLASPLPSSPASGGGDVVPCAIGSGWTRGR